METLNIEYNVGKKCACLTGMFVDLVKEHFSVPNKGAYFAKKLGYRNVPSRLYAITNAGNFGVGMIPRVVEFCKQSQIPYTIDEQLNPILYPSIYDGKLYNVTNTQFILRDYQEECIIKTLKQGRGLLVVGTGGGKTLITSTLIENFYQRSQDKKKFKCLMIVPDLGLVRQTYDEFNKFGTSFTVTKFTGQNQPDLSCNCIIANSQILLHLDEHDKWIKDIDLLIVDEVHKIKKGNKITKLVNKIKTLNRIGCTGTLPTDKIDLWSIIANFGDIVYEKPSSELRNEHFLTDVKSYILHLKYSKPHYFKFQQELEFLMNHEGRNNLIHKIASKCANNILILVNYIEHGEILYEKLKDIEGKQVFFVQGSVDVDDRAEIIKKMEENDNVVCIAISAIFSTGINIKNLHTMIFAAGGKSAIRMIQSIGRGLRLHSNKKQFSVIDLADDLKYGNEHIEERKKIYDSEKIPYEEKDVVVE